MKWRRVITLTMQHEDPTVVDRVALQATLGIARAELESVEWSMTHETDLLDDNGGAVAPTTIRTLLKGKGGPSGPEKV